LNFDYNLSLSQFFLQCRTLSFQLRDSLFCFSFQVGLRPTLFAQCTGKSLFSLFLPLGNLPSIEPLLAKEFTYLPTLASSALFDPLKDREFVLRIENSALGFIVNLRPLYAFRYGFRISNTFRLLHLR
jgi:hypothetical protein